jgi:hypothetical protein
MIHQEQAPRACADAAARYQRDYDWPCTALGHAVWTLAGEELDAVDAPEYLGPGMVSALRDKGRPHAVIEVPGEPATWRFLVRPRNRLPYGLVRELARHGAVYLSHATLVELPPTRVRGGELTWLHAPAATLPELAHVVAALVSVVLHEARQLRAEHGRTRH